MPRPNPRQACRLPGQTPSGIGGPPAATLMHLGSEIDMLHVPLQELAARPPPGRARRRVSMTCAPISRPACRMAICRALPRLRDAPTAEAHCLTH